ncbi:MAG TPA: ATP-binding protein [Candidatus Saccharimonadales bacterium]|nr:ATP-binding protein [Candidatus Saccharimonadales bacterium]
MTKRTESANATPLQKGRSLAQEKAVSDALFLSIGEGALVTDAKGKVSRINNCALELLGFSSPEDAIGKWYPSIVVAEDEAGTRIPNINRPITEVFLTGKTVFKKLYYRRQDQTRIAVALTVSPVLLDGIPIGAIEVFRDITEEVRLERAKDEFISLASHQLRTPATGVKQYAGMLLEGYAGKLREMQRAMVETIYESNERQITIINDLLRVAQVDAGQIQLIKLPSPLIPLLTDVLNEQAHKFKARAQTVVFDPPPEEIWAPIDVKHIRMVLENIIDNASKYTPPNKNVYLALKKTPRYVLIDITDEGVGIPKEALALIFNKFTRLDNPLSTEVGGTGLGLYWVKKIIDLHGAHIHVRSRPGKGSTFTIRLPQSL